MRTIRLIIFGLFAIATVAGTTIYTSCTKKDACSGVTCAHGGSCNNGNCTCPDGVGGTFCDTAYRSFYANIYAGSGSDDETPQRTLSNYRVTLGYPNDATYSSMTMLAELLNGSGNYKTHFNAPIVLGKTTAGVSQFTITPTVNANGFRISGSGTISSMVVSMTVTEADTATSGNIQPTITYTFGTLNMQ